MYLAKDLPLKRFKEQFTRNEIITRFVFQVLKFSHSVVCVDGAILNFLHKWHVVYARTRNLLAFPHMDEIVILKLATRSTSHKQNNGANRHNTVRNICMTIRNAF